MQKGPAMKHALSFLLALGLAATPATAQQLINGAFEQGAFGWTNHPTTSPGGWSFSDIDGDGDQELVLDGTTLDDQFEGVLFIQDLLLGEVDLQYGLALTASYAATNLNGDCRAFMKLEFGNEIVGDHGGSNIAALTMSTEFDPALYATGNDVRRRITLLKTHDALSTELAGLGATLADVAWARAVLFLLRFDQTNAPTGSAYFDDVSFGLVSEAFDVPGIPNGDFEHGVWGWADNPITGLGGTTVADRDGDGDAELELEADGLTNQFANHLYVWETDATIIDFTQGVTLTADLGATNLTPDLRVFTKLEFGAGPAPNTAGATVPGVAVTGEFDPSKYATNNDTRLNTSITMDYATLTNQLAQEGYAPDDLTFVRTVIFLMQFGTEGSPASGSGWFDNLRLDFAFRDRPNATAARVAGSDIVLTWASATGETYRVQQHTRTDDYRWSNVASSVAGEAGLTSYTNPLAADGPNFLRVIRNR